MTNITVLSDGGYNSPRSSQNSMNIYLSKNFNSAKTNSNVGLLGNSPSPQKRNRADDPNNQADNYDQILEERSQDSFDSNDATPARAAEKVIENDKDDEGK